MKVSPTPTVEERKKDGSPPVAKIDVSRARKGDAKPAGEEVYRHVHANDPAKNLEFNYCNNVVITSKYNAANFLPKFLFETFRKIANLYFLLVSIMQTITPISNTDSMPSCLPVLLFIVAVDAVFAILEDNRRHKADREANAKKCLMFDPLQKSFVSKMWREIAVGDIVKVLNRDIIPADIMILAVSEPPNHPPLGICYVETKSLDGETNLKMRQGLESTVSYIRSEEDLAGLKGEVVCESPNKAINKFTGTWKPKNGDPEPIPARSVLLRGCVLRNTDWTFGLVINTGHDTKIMMNSTTTPSKQSSTDAFINGQIMRLVCLLAISCLGGATGSILWNAANEGAWYMPAADLTPAVEWLRMVFYYYLLNYQFIPVSLYVTMASVKFVQSYFINQDVDMYHSETDTPALTRNMILNEELGQIDYIFSDKTGTLTCNIMEFRKCSIDGVAYGRGTTEIGLAALRRAGKPIPQEYLTKDQEGQRIAYVNFYDPNLWEDLKGKSGLLHQQRMEQFFTHLAVCHTVIPEKLEGSDEVIFSASSPDEQALVSGAKFFGYDFYGRSPGTARIKVKGEIVNYTILDVLEFNSTRKRMSCVVRDPQTDKLYIYCKGADAVILPRLDKSDPGLKALVGATLKHMEQFAQDGLRTLAIAMGEVTDDFYADWSKRYREATSSLAEIEKRKKDLPNLIDSCMEEIEQNLTLLGATAIEDKLQEGVPDAIATLAAAGIKIWILTGDKQETAINIGFACQLLTTEMSLAIIETSSHPTKEKIAAFCDQQVARAKSSKIELGLVIDGEALELALHESCKNHLLNLAQYCKAVVACRVSPAQKAQLVLLVKESVPGVRTLAIGDGANDVGMIQAAHVGIGISGQEGMQAVNSSDYAIAQFRFLKRLLLVHGRWNYARMSLLVCYMFYKNIILVLSQYWYTYLAGFSGQKYYNEIGLQLYNIWYTALPIMVLGIYDRDVSHKMALNFPKLFISGPGGVRLSKMIFWSWVAAAAYESVVVTVLSTYPYNDSSEKSDHIPVWGLGMTGFSLVVLVTNAKLLLLQQSFYSFHIIFYVGGIALLVLTEVCISQILAVGGLSFYGVVADLAENPTSWMLLPLAVCLTLGFDFLLKSYRVLFHPSYTDICREYEALGLTDESKLKWDGQKEEKIIDFVSLGTASREAQEQIASKDRSHADRQVTETAIEVLHPGGADVSVSEDTVARSPANSGLRKAKTLNRTAGFAFSNDEGTTRAESHLASRSTGANSLRQVLTDAQDTLRRASQALQQRALTLRSMSASKLQS